MARTFSLLMASMLVASALSAQEADPPPAEPVVVEMKIQRPLSADYNGVADTFDSVQADVVILHYELQNVGENAVEVSPATLAEQVNCMAEITRDPQGRVDAGGAATMVIEVRPEKPGPFSFSVAMAVDGEAYTFPVQSTVTAVLDHEHHCHWWGCHTHDDHHHHCSTGDGRSWLLLGGVLVALAAVSLRRRVSR